MIDFALFRFRVGLVCCCFVWVISVFDYPLGVLNLLCLCPLPLVSFYKVFSLVFRLVLVKLTSCLFCGVAKFLILISWEKIRWIDGFSMLLVLFCMSLIKACSLCFFCGLFFSCLAAHIHLPLAYERIFINVLWSYEHNEP